MNDLISRQAAIDEAKKLLDYYGTNDISKEFADHTAERFMNRVPSAEPKIIRCKDCKYWETEWQNRIDPSMHYCPMTDHSHEGDFYCADAEMRGEGNE